MANHTRTEKLFLEAGRMFNSTLEYEELIEMILKLVSTAVDCESALVFRVDHSHTVMRIRYMNCSRDCKMEIIERDLGSGVVGWVAQYKKPVIINDARHDERYDAKLWEKVDIDINSILSIPLIGKGQMIGVIEALNKNNGGFSDEDLDVLTGLANQIAVAIDNANLYRQAKRELLEKNLLIEISEKLSSSLSLNEVLKVIVDSLKQAIEFTSGGVFIINSDQSELESLYTSGYENCSTEHVRLKFGQGLVGHVADIGEPIIVSNVSENKYYVDMHCDTKSEMLVPLKVEGRTIGVFNIESKSLNAYEQNDLELMTAFAAQAAVSIERARLYEQLVESNKISQQLEIARDIQMSFLPKTELTIKGYDITGENIPSGQVGGDYYDFINIVDNQIGIIIGDVSGKGIPASLLMASFRASMIAEIRNNFSIRIICQKVNRLLYESMQPGNFVTAVYGVLDTKNHILTFSNCGHDLPLILRADDSVEHLSEGGPVLGVTPNATYEERPVYIGSDDIVILFTDGVLEVFNDNEEQFGEERLIDIIRSNRMKSTTEIRDAIYNAVKEFAADSHIFDDFTMIVLKRTI